MTTIRTFKPKQEVTLSNGLQYDINRAIALYGRHSSKKQNGNVATTQQTVGLERFAQKTLGFAKELHRTFYEDLRGVSAYKVPMDERKSYSDLYNAIVQGKIGTVLCYLVDRLFRTKNGEEWELFINACAKNDVKVITTATEPPRIYDLSISKDADEFRQKCMSSRTYIEEIIKGRMNAARDELGRMGLWAGQGVPVGYFIDLEDTSDTYKQYFIYEPHAEIVRAIFRRYRELNGAFNKLMRELEMKQPVFPLFEGLGTPPYLQLFMNEAKTGYTLGVDGLRSILTNPMYIGFYSFKGHQIVDNHPVIADREDFFYAFNRLSRYDLDGNEKETTRTRTRTQGYYGEEKQGVEALLRGKLTSKVFSTINVSSAEKAYNFEQRSHNFISRTMGVPIATLDSVVSEQLVSMLTRWKNTENSETFSTLQVFKSKSRELKSKLQELKNRKNVMFPLDALEEYVHECVQDEYVTPYEAFETVNNEPETVLASIDDQIPALRSRIAKLRRNLDLDADEETLAAWASELKQKVKEITRLEAKQKAIAESQSSQQEATDLIKRVPDQWEQMKFEKKLRAIELLLDTVEVAEESAHFLSLSITWRLPVQYSTMLYVWRHESPSYAWTQEEENLLREYYPKTPIQEILPLLPRRSWSTLKTRAFVLHLQRTCGASYDLPITLTMQDIEFMHTHGIDLATLDVKAKVQVFYARNTNYISLLSS